MPFRQLGIVVMLPALLPYDSLNEVLHEVRLVIHWEALPLAKHLTAAPSAVLEARKLQLEPEPTVVVAIKQKVE